LTAPHTPYTIYRETEVPVGFLVVEGSLSVREALCYLLLSFGIKGIPVATRTAAMQALASDRDINAVIVDIDNQEVEGSRLISEMKENETTRVIPVIVHTVQASKEFVLKMIDQGVTGYLLKPFREDTARVKLASILEKLSDHNIQRKHIRVKPDPQEMIRVHFRLPSVAHLFSGKIIDISLGGLAVELFNPVSETQGLAPGNRISKLQFSLGPRELSPSAFVVLVKSNVVALRFENLAPADKTALERFIFKQISS
jgi:two-component system chemotaxis response regulator CheY